MEGHAPSPDPTPSPPAAACHRVSWVFFLERWRPYLRLVFILLILCLLRLLFNFFSLTTLPFENMRMKFWVTFFAPRGCHWSTMCNPTLPFTVNPDKVSWFETFQSPWHKTRQSIKMHCTGDILEALLQHKPSIKPMHFLETSFGFKLILKA